MPRGTLFRYWKAGVITLAVVLLAAALVIEPAKDIQAALFFAALVLIATFLRIEAGDASIGFEAAVAFGALIIFHSPLDAFIAVLVGTAVHAAYAAPSQRALRLDLFYNAAQLALS